MSKLGALVVIVLVIVVAAALIVIRPWSPASDAFETPNLGKQPGTGFTVLTANVGNADPRCAFQLLKLCRKDVERRLTASLAELRPELVALQETLPDHLCEDVPPVDPLRRAVDGLRAVQQVERGTDGRDRSHPGIDRLGRGAVTRRNEPPRVLGSAGQLSSDRAIPWRDRPDAHR